MAARYDSVIWDWNGTLLDDVALAVDVANVIFREHRMVALTPERYREIFDFPVQRYYERAGMDFARISFEATSRRFCSDFERGLSAAALFDGARRCLDAIRSLGVRQFVLSSTEQAALLRMVSGFGLADVFDDVKGNGDELARGSVGSSH